MDALVDTARGIVGGTAVTRGAAAAICGLCHWRDVCTVELEAADDVTLLPGVGRRVRTALEAVVATRRELAALDVDGMGRGGGSSLLPGVGIGRLGRFRDRARLAVDPAATAYARQPLGLCRAPLEWHLDIESDPVRGGEVYLHGAWERRLRADGGSDERFVRFLAEDGSGEREAFAAAWAFLNSEPDARVYYYSPFEAVSYRALQRRHPDVCTADEVAGFFASPHVVDLYTSAVAPNTEWPLRSYGIKPIAKSLGFRWAAEDAGGAASIAWWDEWLRTGDRVVLDRIVDYNRSDCIASAVVLDGLIALPVRIPAD